MGKSTLKLQLYIQFNRGFIVHFKLIGTTFDGLFSQENRPSTELRYGTTVNF